MTPPPEPHPRQLRYSVRRQARLDAETFAKLEALAHTCHRKRAQIFRRVMPWGLAYTTGSTVTPSIPDRPRPVHMLVDPELLQRVQDAAAAHGVSVAAWLRQAMRQVTPADFPAGWRAGRLPAAPMRPAMTAGLVAYARRREPRGHLSAQRRRFLARASSRRTSRMFRSTGTWQPLSPGHQTPGPVAVE